MNKFLVIVILIGLCVLATFFVLTSKRVDRSIATEVSLERLEQGNARFVSGKMKHPNLTQEYREQLVEEGQEPSAVVVACSDSRVGVEFIFDAGIGELFVIRTAGNVISTVEAASIEYAVKQLKVPLCIVLGHTHCGAVAAAVTETDASGNLGKLVEMIDPAYEKAKKAYPDLGIEELMDKTVEMNVWNSVDTLYQISEPIADSVDKGYLRVMGATYDLETGEVRWLEREPGMPASITSSSTSDDDEDVEEDTTSDQEEDALDNDELTEDQDES
tara:strand:- start:8460 stop:9281 length:822 start_codon:yes stop_codon:yes gene_type:complete